MNEQRLRTILTIIVCICAVIILYKLYFDKVDTIGIEDIRKKYEKIYADSAKIRDAREKILMQQISKDSIIIQSNNVIIDSLQNFKNQMNSFLLVLQKEYGNIDKKAKKAGETQRLKSGEDQFNDFENNAKQ